MARVSNPLPSPSSDPEPGTTTERLGRSREIEEVSHLWSSRRLTVLHGNSGVGKSLMLREGLIPQIREKYSVVWPVGRVNHHVPFPIAALPPQNPFTFPLLASWSPEESPSRLSGLSVQRFLSLRPGTDRFGSPARVHLCIDQAELLFRDSPHREDQRDSFLRDLTHALNTQHNLRLLLILRTAQLEEARSFSRRLGADETETADFQLSAFDQTAATRALLHLCEKDGTRSAGEGWRSAFATELRTIRTASGHTFRTPTIDPSLLGIAYTRFAAEPDDESSDLSAEVNRALGTYFHQALAVVATDHRIRRSRLEEWFNSTFVALDGRAATADIPENVVRALEDKRLIKSRRDSSGITYEIQHPRLLEAIRTSPGHRIPLRRPDAHRRLHESTTAFWHDDLLLARLHAEDAIRTSRPEEMSVRAQAECLLGNLAYTEGQFKAAIKHYETAANLFESLQNTALVGHLLSAIGRLLLKPRPPPPGTAEPLRRGGPPPPRPAHPTGIAPGP